MAIDEDDDGNDVLLWLWLWLCLRHVRQQLCFGKMCSPWTCCYMLICTDDVQARFTRQLARRSHLKREIDDDTLCVSAALNTRVIHAMMSMTPQSVATYYGKCAAYWSALLQFAKLGTEETE